MPLMLTRSDLQPLAEDDGALDAAIDAVEQSVLRSHAGEPGEAVFAGLRLANGDEFGTCFVASATGPASIRLFPHSHDGDRRNAWVGIQIDGRTGEIASLIALDDFNVLRTAVPAALGVRHLAPAGASTLTVLGSGTQARSHVRTFVRVMPHLKQVRIWSPTKEHRERFAAQMADSLGLEVTATDTIEAAVDGADVITATGRTQQRGQPALDDPTCVRPGALFVSMTSSGRNLVPLGARVVMPTARRPQLVAHGFSSGFLATAHANPTGSDTACRRHPRGQATAHLGGRNRPLRAGRHVSLGPSHPRLDGAVGSGPRSRHVHRLLFLNARCAALAPERRSYVVSHASPVDR